jgi:hypothetical protein
MGQGQPPLSVLAQVNQGPYFVGQAIEVWVSAEARDEVPRAVAPQIADAEVTPLDAEPKVRQITTNAIGDVVNERNRYTFRYRIIAHRAGTLVVPPVKLQVNDRAGSSAPLRIPIRALPVEGRPAAFLGGVGRLQVEALAEPTTLRAGQTIEYQVRLFGPAARGSTREPDLEALRHLPIAPEVETLPAEEVADPPSHTFHYRLRPTRAGASVLPPVPVAYFDPKAERYLTRVTQGVPIQVVDVPKFDPGNFQYVPSATARPSLGERIWHSRWGSVVLGLVSVLVLWPVLLAAFVVIGRVQLRLEADPGRFARGVSRHFDARLGAGLLAEQVATALARYLRRAAGRPEGVLTPLEARHGILELTSDPELADRAERLVRACDRARFAGRPASAEELADDARVLFEKLGRQTWQREVREVGKNRGRHSQPLIKSSQHVPPQDIRQVESDRQ